MKTISKYYMLFKENGKWEKTKSLQETYKQDKSNRPLIVSGNEYLHPWTGTKTYLLKKQKQKQKQKQNKVPSR